MISITDIKVSKTYRDGKYYEPAYETRLAIRLPETYSDHWIVLGEDATAKVVELIVSLASENLRFEHYVPRKPKEPEQPEDAGGDAPPAYYDEAYAAIKPMPAGEMEPL
ncbi:hypothetical protein [Sphingomonas oryzagri]|uniref:Uncharacterized protein n=1 Tax=Sphingomonas oryzagri TaxID=3042314 RepID=A0ABT6N1H5_9SPHN|nr:hypothetical protein [Sphingomonas oryzagri]MDH7638927.1 hypothetical protein [Sphingomonas oryzagri]